MTRKQIDDIEKLNKVIKSQKEEIYELVGALLPFAEIYLDLVANKCENNELELFDVIFLKQAFDAVEINIQ